MNKYIFTFGCGQKLAGFCQPIYAKDYTTARQRMVDIHGSNWSMSYTEEEWEAAKEKLRSIMFPVEKELEPIKVYEEDKPGKEQPNG
ncbi:MAG: hypothetical protein M0R40_00500 [Firmicutes bacterium]|nr:hypothetical protein [Bacillota bacterium]